MSQRTERVDELLRQEIGTLLAKELADPADRVHDDHGRRDVARPPARQGLGQRHRRQGRPRRDPARAPGGDGLHPPRAGQAPADQAHPRAPHPPRRLGRAGHARPPPPPGARGGRGARGDHARSTSRCPRRSSGCPTRATRSPRKARPSRARSPRSRPRPSRAGRRPGAERAPRARARAHPRTASRRKPGSREADERTRRPRRPSPATPSRARARAASAPARNVLAVSHEHPDADTLGAVIGICLLVEALGWPRDRRVHGPGAAAVRLHARASTGSATDPDPAEAYDLLVLADCAIGRAGRGGRRPQRGAVRGAAAGDHRPPRLERPGGRGRLDRPGRGGDLRAGRAARRAPRPAARSRATGRSPTR